MVYQELVAIDDVGADAPTRCQTQQFAQSPGPGKAAGRVLIRSQSRIIISHLFGRIDIVQRIDAACSIELVDVAQALFGLQTANLTGAVRKYDDVFRQDVSPRF